MTTADEPPSRPPERITLRHRLEYVAIRVSFAVIGVLPEAIAYRVVGWLGSLFVRCSRHRRCCALRMLRNAYPGRPDRELLRLARAGAGNLLRVSLDMVRVGKMLRNGRFDERVDMSEFDALSLRAPWVGVTGHLGSWECGAIAIARRGDGSHVTARLLKNPLAQRFLLESRREAGLWVHDRRGGIRGLIRALDDGATIMQVVDQHQRLRGIVVPFFGEPASTERAAATFAVRRRLPMLVAAGIRVGVGFRFRIVIGEVLQPPDTGDADADVRTMVTRMNGALERLILRFPEQYLWIHDRYRVAEDGDAVLHAGRDREGTVSVA